MFSSSVVLAGIPLHRSPEIEQKYYSRAPHNTFLTYIFQSPFWSFCNLWVLNASKVSMNIYESTGRFILQWKW